MRRIESPSGSWWGRHHSKVPYFFSKSEIKKYILRSLLYSDYYTFQFKFYFVKLFHNYSKFTSISFYRSVCGLSSWGRVVFRKFNISRHFLKHFSSHGYLVGIRKSSF